jgi:hypothetical protein
MFQGIMVLGFQGIKILIVSGFSRFKRIKFFRFLGINVSGFHSI